jgi:hypothetical protein
MAKSLSGDLLSVVGGSSALVLGCNRFLLKTVVLLEEFPETFVATKLDYPELEGVPSVTKDGLHIAFVHTQQLMNASAVSTHKGPIGNVCMSALVAVAVNAELVVGVTCQQVVK